MLATFVVPDAIGAALVLAAVDIPTKITWVMFQAIWKMPTVTAGLWFALEYANLDRWLNRCALALLALPPFLVLLFVVTNDAHHRMWTGFVWDGYIRPVIGPANWWFTGYGLLLASANSLVFLWLFVRSPLHRRPAGLCLCGQIAARVVFLLDRAGNNPVAPMDPYIFICGFTATMYALALFRYRMFNLLPVARGTIIQQMREGMLLLDAQLRVIDVNPAAERMLGVTAARAKGRDVIQLLPAISEFRRMLCCPGNANSEVALDFGGTSQYTLRLSPLQGRHGYRLGCLILLYDTTEQTRAQVQALEQQRALATLQERDRVARELHDSIGQVLGYVKLQAQAARQLLARGRTAEANESLVQLVAAAQEAHVDVRDYILGAHSEIPAGGQFVPGLDMFVRRFGQTHGIEAKLAVEPGFDGKDLKPMAEAQLSRIIQETLSNVRKHARARRVSVQLTSVDHCAEAVVQDDGVGFNPDLLETAEGQRFGLQFMRERAEEVGGTVNIRSAPGEGTTVIVRVPLGKEHT
jgi:PAS domain S-box-containing protein